MAPVIYCMCVCKFEYMYLLSHQQASLCMCLNYSWVNLATLVPCGTVRMFHRLWRKILSFVCFLCLGTIKTRGHAIGTALFTVQTETATPERWSRVARGNKCLPMLISRRKETVGSLTSKQTSVWGLGTGKRWIEDISEFSPPCLVPLLVLGNLKLE